MKKIQFLVFFLSSFFSLHAQKELWGVNNDLNQPFGEIYYGNITKYDINGQNPVKIHEFDLSEGIAPNGKLFLASNGKIYGTTIGNGIIFEYDLILNNYTIVHNFTSNINYQFGAGLIEPVLGKLFGVRNSSPYSYEFNTGIYSESNTFGETIVNGNLVKASNGFLYGASQATYCGPNDFYNYGTIFKINPVTLALQTIFRFNCNNSQGAHPLGNLIEATFGKLYGVTYDGGIGGFGNFGGTLFEFDINTNALTVKVEFDGDNLGKQPYPLVNGGNGKLYGVCRNGGTNIFTNPNNSITYTTHNGTLFEYTPATNVINKLHDFGDYNNNGVLGYSAVNPISLMKTTNGYFMGTSEQNPFKFDPVNNTVVNTINGNIPFNTNRLLNFIEICRKPSYQEFLPNTYAPEVGTTFTFNVNNDNATTFVWKRGTTVLPAQTTGTLNLPSITTSDTGVYTCTMTNECGMTVTMNLNINVTNLAVDTVDNYKQQISLYPNPTKGVLNLKFPEDRGLKGLGYKITNLLGQVIEERNLENNKKSAITIDTSSFANGVYQISLFTDKGNWYGKFVKE